MPANTSASATKDIQVPGHRTPNRRAIYVNGEWMDCSALPTIDVHSASTGQVLSQVPAAGADQARQAVKAAKSAWPQWRSLSPLERSSYLKKIADGLHQRAEELASCIALEVGMPLKLAGRVQVAGPVKAWENYAALAAEKLEARKIGHSLIVREPVGVVACITPWNYPLHQITAKVAAALAAGCTVVLKPSEVAPGVAYLLCEVMHEAGLPAGVFNMVMGTGPEAGEPLVTDPDVHMASFTGSTAAGKRVAALAAQTVKRVALELGGKSAAVVLDDADLALAVKATVNGCFLNSGQTCSAPTRMLVPESRYEEAASLAIQAASSLKPGDPLDPASRLGPLVSGLQRERVRTHISHALEDGAKLLCGGADVPDGLHEGYYVQPTVFGRVAPDSRLAQEEVFGPVLAILTYKTEDEAVQIANGTKYGLAATVWSGDQNRALKIALSLRAGQVDINGAPFNLDAPFGGYAQSGYGRENGTHGFDEFLETKSVQLPK